MKAWFIALLIGIFIMTATLVVMPACTDAEWQRTTAWSNPHTIVMYSGGQKVGEWVSTGCPRSVADEDGWQFVDQATGHFVTVTGDVVIVKMPEGWKPEK